MSAIRIHTDLTAGHEDVLTAYLRGESRLTRAQWHQLREAVHLLRQSTVIVHGQDLTFTQFYEAFIDSQFADPFLQALVTTEDLAQEAPRLQADTARKIVQWLREQEFYQQGQVASRLLLVFCLYWWAAFAIGYAFEVEIFHDLQAAGVTFVAHDITNRAERLSPFDLIVLGLRGDVKTSTYFLTAEELPTEGIDFFITRLYDEAGARWLQVLFLLPAAWAAVDGETTPVAWEEVGDGLPEAVSVTLGAMTYVVISYDDWKGRVLTVQDNERR